MKKPIWCLLTCAVVTMGIAVGNDAWAQSKEQLTVAVSKVTSTGPIYLAIDRGYFRDAGLDVSLASFDNGNDPVLAAASGSAQLAATPLGVGFYNLAAKGGIKAIAGYMRDEKGFHDTGIVVSNALWDAGLRSPAGLKGKRIGITTIGGSTFYALGRIFQKYGFTIDDATIVPLQTTTNIIAAFKGGQVDAMVGGSPAPIRMQNEGFGKILAYTGDERSWQFGGVLANATVIGARHQAIATFLTALKKGAADYSKAFMQRDSAGNMITGDEYDVIADLIAKNVGLPKEALGQAWPYVDPTLMLDSADVADQITFWKSRKVVDEALASETTIDRSFGTIR